MVGFEIKDIAGDDGEGQPVHGQAETAEHPLDRDRTERREKFVEKFAVHRPRPAQPSILAAVSCTDSPQPHALIWFGLLNTNCACIRSVL